MHNLLVISVIAFSYVQDRIDWHLSSHHSGGDELELAILLDANGQPKHGVFVRTIHLREPAKGAPLVVQIWIADVLDLVGIRSSWADEIHSRMLKRRIDPIDLSGPRVRPGEETKMPVPNHSSAAGRRDS